MEKINLRPIFKVVDAVIQPLGWLPLKKAQYVDLMLACSTADFKRILRIHNRQPHGLTEEQKTDLFIKVGQDVAWFEQFNADPSFRKEVNAKSQSGSNEDPHVIEEKFKSLYYNMVAQGWFPNTFEGQKLAVNALDIYSEKSSLKVDRSSLFEFLLSQDIWNPQTLQWLAEDAVDSAHSYNRLKSDPSSVLIQTLASYRPFQPHQIEPFLENNFHNINWMQLERKRGPSDISTLRPLWELGLKELSESFVKQLIEKNPDITKKLNFTTVLSQRPTISIELFEAIMLQDRMSIKRLLRKSRDPQGILNAVKNNHVQSYSKQFVNDDPYTKSVLAYLVHKETQATHSTIMEALEQDAQSSQAVLSTRRKM